MFSAEQKLRCDVGRRVFMWRQLAHLWCTQKVVTSIPEARAVWRKAYREAIVNVRDVNSNVLIILQVLRIMSLWDSGGGGAAGVRLPGESQAGDRSRARALLQQPTSPSPLLSMRCPRSLPYGGCTTPKSHFASRVPCSQCIKWMQNVEVIPICDLGWCVRKVRQNCKVVLLQWRHMGNGFIVPPRHYVEVSDQLHAPATLPLGISYRYPLVGRWVGPRICLDAAGRKICCWGQRMCVLGTQEPTFYEQRIYRTTRCHETRH
jgi:hypothetical protein